ncbi:MAG: tetratricopeptide repeat protein [Xanthomonadales bacterium]|nr:tetratricopeptide repeat protein [Xanthomonadales bacterium]
MMFAVRTLLLLLLPTLAVATESMTSKSIIGPQNTFLADGASALMSGDYAEGVRLTEIGLRFAGSNRDRGAAHNNLCAGLMKMDQLELALEHCDTALSINPNDWHAYSNRAGVLLQMDRLEEAEEAVEKGLAIRPNSRTLLKILDVARSMRYRPQVSVVDER